MYIITLTFRQDINNIVMNIRMIKSLGTHIKVKDLEKSKNFYNALGFKKVFEYGPGTDVEEDYNGIVFEHANCKLEIADGHRAVKPEIFRQKVSSSKISLMIYINSLSDIINRCKKSKIKILVKPRHYYWGTLELVVKDPDGVVLVFIAPYSKKEAKLIKADESFALKPEN
jgi:predicted lactoylglutathione lyase